MSEHIVFIEASGTGAGEKSIQYARHTGRRTTLMCQTPEKYPASIRDYADRIIRVDTNNADAVITALGSGKSINAITTTNDFFVVEAARAAEHFGLPTTSSADVYRAKNKYLMREALRTIAPDLNPAFVLANNLQDAQDFAARIGYPFIAKPQDANDSLYVQIIHDADALTAYFAAREEWGQNIVGQAFAQGVLLEQVVGGEEYCLDVLQVWQGPMILMGAFHKKLAGQETGNFIKIGASFPAQPDVTETLYQPISAALQQLGIKVGAVNIDCKIVDGQVKILEINPRLVGDQMGSHMIPLATGMNPAHAIVELALGHGIDWQPTENRAVAIHRITMPQPGYYTGIQNAAIIAADPNVAWVNDLGEKGAWYEPARSNQQVVGSVIAIGPTPDDAMKTAHHWARQAQIYQSDR